MASKQLENIISQQDEIDALSAIYGEDFHHIKDLSSTYLIVIKESLELSLQFTLQDDYPSLAPPIYKLIGHWLKGHKRAELSGYLEEIYLENCGESIIYLWVERMREFIQNEEAKIEPPKSSNITSSEAKVNDIKSNFEELVIASSPSNVQVPCPSIISGDILSDRKSHFQPHLASVTSLEEVRIVISKLYEEKKIANATHNMYAYRFIPKNSKILHQDCEDDGEAHAGSRMLHLLQILDVRNVVVLVSRWFGGIQLGPDRFKHINNVTRQILDTCGYIKQKGDKKKEKTSNHRKKK